MNTASRIIRWKLEVADSDTRETIECLEGHNFGEHHVVEDGSKCQETKLWCRDGPVEAGVM